MTTDELTDWHAKREGWRFLTVEDDRANADDPIGIKVDSWVRKGASYFPEVRTYFPFPATIDGAASAMPPGWGWWRVSAEWVAQAASTPFVRVTDTGDETHDRYLLAKLAWEANFPEQTSPT